jgi:hypothetical protein
MAAMSPGSPRPSSQCQSHLPSELVRLHRPSLALLLALSLSGIAPRSLAATPTADEKAAARELALIGMDLKDKGDCPAALEKLERAEQLYHAPTILTAIGECQIALGRLVEGTENLKKVSLEHIDPKASSTFFDAQNRARKLLDETLPRIAKLTIELDPELEDVELLIDDVKVSSALIGVRRPTDPGRHTVTVRKQGYLDATAEVTLEEAGDEKLTLTLSPDPAAAAADEATPPEALETDASIQTAAAPPRQKSTQPVLGWIGIGVGAAALGAGAVTGVLALDQANHLTCPNDVCSGSDAGRLDSALSLATASTILLGAGGALAVTGVILLLTSPSEKASARAPLETQFGNVRLTPEVYAGGAGFRGSF